MGRRKKEIEQEEREALRDEQEELAYARHEAQYENERRTKEQEEPLTRKEKIAYEKQLVKEGKIIPRYAPRNPLGRILALIFVFFFGIFAAIGGIIGTFAYLGTRPLKDGLGLFNLQYNEFLTEEAANKSVLDLVETAKDFQSINTLGKIKDYTPLVDKLLGGVNEQIKKLGVHIDMDELSATPFDQLGTYFSQNVVQTIVLGEVLSVKPDSNPLLVSLCYGEENVDYEVETVTNDDGSTSKNFKMIEGHSPLSVSDLTKEGSDTGELLQKLSLENVLGITAGSDPAMRYLAYGSEGVHYEIVTDEADGSTSVHMLENPETHEPYKKKTVADLTEEGADLLGGAKISDLLDTTNASGIIGAVKDWTITDMGNSDKIMELYIRDIIDVEEGDGILGAIKDKQLKALSDAEEFKSIKISAIIDATTATGILKTIADREWTIGDLSDGDNFKTLKIEEIVPLENATGIMNAIKGWTIDDLSDSANIENLKINEIIENPTDGILGAMSDWSINDLSNTHRIERIKISQIIGEPKDGDSLLMQTIASWRIGDMKDQAKLEALTLSNFLSLDPDDPQILLSLADTPIGEFGTAIDNMRLSDVLGENIKSNKLLSKLSNSTLSSLSGDIEKFTIGDLFGDELYSFLEIKDNNTYADLVKAYETGHTIEETSANPITPVWRQDIDKSKIVTYYKHGDTEVAFALFEKSGEAYVALNGSFAVYPAENGTKYIEREIRLTPVYEWKAVDYTNGGLVPLPEGAAVDTADNGLPHAYELAEGETAATEHGAPLYFVTTTQAYPLLKDNYSYYYKTGTDLKERADLDKVLSAYKDGDDLLRYDGGKVTYAGAEYAVRTSNAEKYDYILAHYEVIEGYAVAGQASYTAEEIYARDEVTEHWRDENGAELDRFLDGVWYLLFGGETWDKTNPDHPVMTVVDKTDTALFEIAGTISGVPQKLNKAPLWKLYLHGIIEANPYANIGGITNLNELTITGLINYVTGN